MSSRPPPQVPPSPVFGVHFGLQFFMCRPLNSNGQLRTWRPEAIAHLKRVTHRTPPFRYLPPPFNLRSAMLVSERTTAAVLLRR
jgi:hypothetical protein